MLDIIIDRYEEKAPRERMLAEARSRTYIMRVRACKAARADIFILKVGACTKSCTQTFPREIW